MDEKQLKRFANLFNAYCESNLEKAKELFKEINDEPYDFVAYIGDILTIKNIQKNELLQKAYIPVKYGYKILNGTKHTTNRDVILRICIAAEMDLEQTNKCLYLNQMPNLNELSKRDSLICCAIQSKGRLKIEKLNDWLLEFGFPAIID